MITPTEPSSLIIWHDGCIESAERLELSTTIELRNWSSDTNPSEVAKDQNKLSVFVGKLEQDQFPRLIEQSYSGIIEFCGPADLAALQRSLTAVLSGKVTLNLTSRTAYGQANAEHFCELLSRHIELDESRQPELLIVLQEAIANAILHGNLQIETAERDEGFKGLERQYQALEERLTHPSLGNRRVEIHADRQGDELTISVINEGPGYVAPNPPPPLSGPPRRGMELIRSLTNRIEIEQGGRCLNLFLVDFLAKPISMPTVSSQSSNEAYYF